MTHLDELPVELIVQVFEHIPSRDLWSNVRLVCRIFASIIGSSQLWLLKIRKLDVALPQCQVEQQDFHLAECCCAIEDEMGRWASDRLQRYVSVTGHLGTVDAIRLLETSAHKRLCITGSRDRSLIVWDVSKIAKRVGEESWKLQLVPEAHQGWIWSVCRSGPDAFYSSSWDRYVKQWQIVSDRVEKMCAVELSAAVLCVVDDGTVVICSSFDRKISALDARDSLHKVAELEFHRSAVFDLAQTDIWE